jgi:hypothetical protein
LKLLLLLLKRPPGLRRVLQVPRPQSDNRSSGKITLFQSAAGAAVQPEKSGPVVTVPNLCGNRE